MGHSNALLQSVSSDAVFERSCDYSDFDTFSDSYLWNRPQRDTRRDTTIQATERNPVIGAGVYIGRKSVDHEGSRRQSGSRQSRRLPSWLWSLFHLLLGVRGHESVPRGRALLGNLLFVLTVATGFLYASLHTIYMVYNASSDETTFTVLEAVMESLSCLFGTSLGIYSNRLARKIFQNLSLKDTIRMHTKSLFKVSASVWAALLITGFIAADTFDRVSFITQTDPSWQETPTILHCKNLSLPVAVCTMEVYSRTAYAILAGLWNYLVLVVILSMCRTHAVEIRRFIKECEADGRARQEQYRQKMSRTFCKTTSAEYLTTDALSSTSDDDDDEDEDDVTDITTLTASDNQPFTTETEACRSNNNNNNNNNNNDNNNNDNNNNKIFGRHMTEDLDEVLFESYEVCDPVGNGRKYRVRRAANADEKTTRLTVDDILVRHWSINSRLCRTGATIQRWVTSWIVFVIFWTAQFIIYWIRNKADVSEILTFAIPLVILPLLCSAISEANFEGDRLVRRIFPLGERLDLLLFLSRNPLHLSFFGQTVRFSNMSNALAGLATAVFTGIAINQLKH